MSVDPDLDREYSPSSVSKKPATDYIVDYGQRSQKVVAALGDRLARCAYGPGTDEYVVMSRHSPSAPLLVFIHGGYWRALSADGPLASEVLGPASPPPPTSPATTSDPRPIESSSSGVASASP